MRFHHYLSALSWKRNHNLKLRIIFTWGVIENYSTETTYQIDMRNCSKEIWEELGYIGRRQRQSTLVLLPGKFHGWRSLEGCSPCGLEAGHDWVTSLSLFTFMHWRRKWQPTPAFLPGESQGPGSLVGCRLWGRTESDTTEAT